MTCETCQGHKILIPWDWDESIETGEADHVVRCDDCQKYFGDKEALFAFCQQVPYGAWAVWAEDLDGHLVDDESGNSLTFARSDLESVALLQSELAAESDGEYLVYFIFVEHPLDK
jgi:hypothetical protein